MKKTLIAVLALAAVVACNKTEVVEQSAGNAIAFDNAFIDNATKSVSDPSFTNTNLFSDFAVYGFVEGASLFEGTQVSKSITNSELKSDWKYEGTQYWIAGANYNFGAIAPMTNGNWTIASCGASKPNSEATEYVLSTHINFTNNGTTDLMFANSGSIQGQLTGNDKVAFTFNHLLSKVKFSFTNGYNATNATIKVRNIKITNTYLNGYVTPTDNPIRWSNHKGTLELAFGNAVAEGATSEDAIAYAYNTTLESYKELLLIPGDQMNNTVDNEDDDGYKVTFTVDLLVSGTLIKSYDHTAVVDFTPVAGKCYDISATINAQNIDPNNEQEPIEFTVTSINGWGDATDVPATIQ